MKQEPTFDLNQKPAEAIDMAFGQAGRREWNERYFHLQHMMRHWQWAFGGMSLMVILLSAALIWLASQSQVKPFIVETNQGYPVAIKALESISPDDQRLVNYAVDQFIIHAKTVVADKEAQSMILKKLYAYTGDQAVNFLRQYHQQYDPFLMSQHTTTQVNIVHTMPLSQQTWQVVWDEIKRDRQTHQVLETQRWMAQLDVNVAPVNELFLVENPFGIVITDVHWSPQKTKQ